MLKFINKKIGFFLLLAFVLVTGYAGSVGAAVPNAVPITSVFLTRIGGIMTTSPRSNAFSVGTTTPNGGKLNVYLNELEAFPKAFSVASTTGIGTATTTKDLFVVRNSGNVGVGTSSPGVLLDVFSTGTSTVRADTNSATKGGCLVLKSSTNTYGYFVVTGGATNFSLATTSAANCQ